MIAKVANSPCTWHLPSRLAENHSTKNIYLRLGSAVPLDDAKLKLSTIAHLKTSSESDTQSSQSCNVE